MLSKLSLTQYGPSVARLKDRFGDDYVGGLFKEIGSCRGEDGEDGDVDVKLCLRVLYEEAFRM